METSRGISLGWLGHPLSVVALVVLVVNDHVLKAAYPGWVTGKLSDAAGLVLAPPLLAVLVALLGPRLRPRWVTLGAVVTVGVGFAAVKSFPYGAELASAAWSVVTPSRMRADPADLLVLPCLALAWWSLRRSRSGRAAWSVRRVGGPSLRILVLLPLALVGVAATSPARSDAAEKVVAVRGGLYLNAEIAYRDTWVVSRDAGVSWSEVAPAQVVELRLSAVPPRPEACAPEVCYRVVPAALAVEAGRDGGGWADSWRISQRDRKALYRAYGDVEGIDVHLASRAVAVQEVAGGGYVVAVANGRDGFAVRGTDGRWRRVGFPAMVGAGPEAPYDLAAAERLVRPALLRFVAVLVLFGVGVVLAVAGASSLRRVGGGGVWWWVPAVQVVVSAPVLLVAAVGALSPGSVLDVLAYFAVFGVGLIGAGGVLTVLIAGARRVAAPGRWLAWVAVSGFLAVAVLVLVSLGWIRAAPGRTDGLVGCLILAVGVVTVVGTVLTGRVARPRVVEPEPAYPVL